MKKLICLTKYNWKFKMKHPLILFLLVIAVLAVNIPLSIPVDAATTVQLSVTGISPVAVSFLWSESKDSLFQSYTVQSSAQSGGPWTNVQIFNTISQTSFFLNGRTFGTTQWFRVEDTDSLGSAYSNTVQVNYPATATLTDSQNGNNVNLTWNNNATYGGVLGFNSYNILENTGSGFTQITTINSESQKNDTVSISPLLSYAFEVETIDQCTASGSQPYLSPSYSNSVQIQAAQPTVTSFTSTSGGSGTSVTITGTNLTFCTAVSFGGTAVASFTVNSVTQITAVVGSGATGMVSVTTPGGTANSTSTFTFVAVPTVTSFTPTSGVTGTSVTITGTNLSGSTTVKFGGTAAAGFTVNSATQITATVGSGATGTISVTTPGGTANSTSTFTFVAPPTVTSFTPTSGNAGTSVTITGTNLAGTTAVKFGGTAAAGFTVNSATQITATVGSGATGTISVTTLGGTANSTSTFTFVTVTTYQVSISSGQGGSVSYSYSGNSGTVSAGNTKPISVPSGTEISLTANPDSQHVFQSWSTTGSVTVGNTNSASTTLTVSGTGGVMASFASNPVVTITPGSATIQLGNNVSFSATATGGSGTYTDYMWHWEQFNTTNRGNYDSGSSNTYSFAPANIGSYGVYVVVTDSQGNTAQSLESSVIVQNTTTPTTGSLQVMAYDKSTGNPLNGATVQMTQAPIGQALLSDTADSNGSVIFSTVLPGSYTVSVSASGYQTATGSGSVTAGQTGEITVTLTAQVTTYQVSITSGQGGNVSYSYGANTGMVQAGQTHTLSVPSGNISLIANPDLQHVLESWPTTGSVSVSSSVYAWTTLTVNGNGGVTATFASNLAVALTPGMAAIQPTGDVNFQASAWGGSGGYTYVWTWEQLGETNRGSQSTGSSEKWMFTPSSIGTYAVWVVVTDSSGNTNIALYSTVTVETQPPANQGNLQAVVYDLSTGNAVSGAAVQMTSAPSGQQLLSGTTDSRGSVIFSNIQPGAYTMSVSASGYQPSVGSATVTAGQTAEITSSALSPLVSQINVFNGTSGFVTATFTMPDGNWRSVTVAPNQTEPLVKGVSVSGETGVSADVGLGLADIGTSYTVDNNGVGTWTVTGGAVVVLRFSVYYTTAGDIGICWSPGAAIGVGADAEIEGDICMGTNGYSIGGRVTGGIWTGGGSIQIQPSVTTSPGGPFVTDIPAAVIVPGSISGSVSAIEPSGSSVFGQSVIFSAPVNPFPSGGTVQFFDGSTSLSGSLTLGSSGDAQYTTSSLPIGAHTITAVYSGDGEDTFFAPSTSSPISWVVAPTQSAPTVSYISPTSGPTVGGTGVTITGSNLTGSTEVDFGINTAINVSVVSATEITCTSPAEVAGTVDVTVTTPGGTSATSASDKFTYTAPAAAPTVTGISPTSGSTVGGTTVTVTGTGFYDGGSSSAVRAVNFGNTADTSINVTSDTSLTVVSPAEAAGTVDVTVTTPGGTSATSGSFTVVAEPLPASKLIVFGYSSPATVGVEGNFTVTAQDGSGNTVTSYTGTIHFTSSDSQAVLPANYTFVRGDSGTHTFTLGVTLETAGSQSITATDTVTGSITGTQSGIKVNAAAPSQIRVETVADGSGTVVSAQNVTTGNSITVYAITRDQYSNFVANVAGTWSLLSITGGVAAGDLVASGDTKSAVFTGHLTGTAVIHVTSGALANTPSGTITVISNDATLSGLSISSGTLTPSFGSTTYTYTDSVANSISSVTVTPTANQANATIKVNTILVNSGQASGAISLSVGSNTITVQVIAQDGSTVETYSITVIRGGVTKFSVSGYTSPMIAGTAGSITVLAQDGSGNTITNYTGTIHFTSSDRQAVLPSDYTFVGSDNGTHTFNVTLKTADSQSITATDTLINTITGTQSNITINPAAASQVTVETGQNGNGITVPTQNVTSGSTITVFAITRDPYGNFISNVAGIWSLINKTGGIVDSDLLPSSDNKSAVFTGNKMGTVVINVISGNLSPVDSGTLTVISGPLTKFNVSGYSSPSIAGVPGNITLTAQDASGNIKTSFTGTIHFTSSDPQASLPADYTFVGSDNGTHTFVAALKTAGSQSITATYTLTNATTGTQNGINVNPAVAGQIGVETAANGSGNVLSANDVTTGSSIAVYAITRDQYGNFVANVPGIWSLISKTGSVADSDLVSTGDKKSAIFTGHLLGTSVIHVTSTSLINVDSGLITVTPKITITGYASPSIAGVSHSFTVTVQDGAGNTITSYIGTIHFTSSDTQALLPTDYTFVSGDNGTHMFSATLDTDGSQSITTTDTVTGSITGSQTGITVNAATATQIRVETAANGSGNVTSAQNITAGYTVTVFAITRDKFGNFVANVAATWSLTGKTSGVATGDLIPASDNKSAVFTGHLVGTGIINVSITGLASINSGTITVIAGALDHLQITIQPSSTLSVDYALNTPAVVTAYDVQNNPIQGVNIVADRDPNTGTGLLLGTLTVNTNSNGQAIFSNLLYHLAFDVFRIRFTSNNITIISSLIGPLKPGAPFGANIETAADGSGTQLGMITNPHVPVGSSITAYCITRDQYGNFVANVAADSWSLFNMTGGVVNTDLVASSDNKSAVFTGHQTGEAFIHMTMAPWGTAYSGAIIVIAAPSGGGGGGGGGGGISAPITAGVTDVSTYVNAKGVFDQNINIWSDDTNAVVTIPSGTTGLTASGAPLTQISMVHMTTPPAFQTGVGMIDIAYDITPNGITFNPAVTLEFTYYNLPAGMDPSTLQIAYYDTTKNAWVTVPSTVNTVNNYISAQISHFTVYAITYGVKPVTTTTPTTTTTTPATTIPPITTTLPPITITTSATTSTTTTPTSTTATTSPVTTTVTGTGTVDVSNDVTAGGEFIGPVILSSADNNATINIPAGISGTTSDGQPLTSITVTQLSEPPASPPAGENIISSPYEFGPSGAHFNSPITMTFSYDPTKLASGAPETSLVIAYYSISEGQWVTLGGVVDTVNHTITVQVNHFTAFAVITGVTTTTPTKTPTTTNSVTTPTTTSTTGLACWLIVLIAVVAIIVIVVLVLAIVARRKK